MSLTAYNFQFYSYNMPTHRPGAMSHHDSMDVDDIDMSLPPPKPPRASAMMANSSSTGNIPTTNAATMPWLTSTPICSMPVTPKPMTTTGVNYFTDGNETPKSIYSGGLTAGGTAAAEMQLRPKLHVPLKRWSTELRAKALEMSKRSSGSEEESTAAANAMTAEKQSPELDELEFKPQTHNGRKSWSCAIREKALQMTKRNSGVIDDTQSHTTAFQAPVSASNNKRILVNAGAYEWIQNKSLGIHHQAEVAAPATLENNINPLNNTFPFTTTNATGESLHEDTSQSVKERICYFNTLTSSGISSNNNSNLFLNLLKNSNTQTRATIQPCASSTTTPNTPPFATPSKPKRWSTHIDLHLQQPSPTLATDNLSAASSTAVKETSCPKISSFSFSSSSATTSYSNTPTTSTSYTSTAQRKTSLRRKPSMEKSRRPILRQNSTVGSGTKPQMHAVMEDLSLVMPVKLRVAEYERRIMMEC